MKLKVALLTLLAVMLVDCAGPPPKPTPASGPDSATHRSTPDGYYRVRRGDNLSTVAFRFGLDWREIARLNNIAAPYIIYPDQELRLTENLQGSAAESPAAASTAGPASVQIAALPSPGSSTTRTMEAPRSTTTSIDTTEESSSGSVASASQAATPASADADTTTEASPTSASARTGAGTAPVGTQAPSSTAYVTPGNDPSRWLWPTEGRVVSRFQANDPARKGIDIGGKVGQSVVATANGQVVYSGNGLLGYGELIIIKHSDRMLSAYAHNSKRLVSEGQQVTAGNQIAEMGTNDRNQAQLHFEIRVNGSPQDPLKYLPTR